MGETSLYPILPTFEKHALVNSMQYQEMYARSLRDPKNFWGGQADKLTWFKRYDEILTGGFKNLDAVWFPGGKLNACYNCLDRHLAAKGNQAALIWEGDSPDESKTITYHALYQEVCQLANALKKLHIKKGDAVAIYMPMIPEAVAAMLACARIGAVHTVVFGGFSSDALLMRMKETKCQVVITANAGMRGGKVIPLKHHVDEALEKETSVHHVIVVKRTEHVVAWQENRDHWYHEMIATESMQCPCDMMDSQDALFVLYTSGSTGKPKGILHTLAGYLVYVAVTYQYVFDYHENDIYWCTADMGWITGHSYTVYGPLCNGATTVIFEGVPHFPTPSRFWEIIDKHQVNVFYTAPTAIRALRREGDTWVTLTQRHSLRLLGSVGEPINPDVWEWYYRVVGDNRCPIVDTWWQTETGGILISPLPGATPLKPGSATRPFFGVVPEVVDDQGNAMPEGQMGKLVIKQPWPGMMQGIYGDRDRFVNDYFKAIPGCYFTGDDAKRDSDGYFWITGRNDDVIKVSGHRIGTGEIESAFIEHPAVSEVGVVAVPHAIKGESIYAFVTLKEHMLPSEKLKKELIQQVRHSIGAIATPDYIQWAEALPKTRSGKIMRRLLRKIANNDAAELGDTSTLADPQVINDLLSHRIAIL